MNADAKIYCLLSVLIQCTFCMHLISVQENKPPPTFPNVYVANATLKLPYAEIVEPLNVWFDEIKNRSRIDYYDGLMKTYQRADKDPRVNRKVAYFTNDTLLNVLTCFEVEETNVSAVTTQSILPDTSGFKTYLGQKAFSGKLCDVWELVQTVGDKDNTYRFWAITDEKNESIPVRYEMFGKNTLLGSHYDKYEIVYDAFKKMDSIDAKIFELDSDVGSCGSFPGPGVAHDGLINPMQEFIGGKDEHVTEMFDDFKTQHNKQYENDAEELQRQKNFLHNLRLIHSHNRAGKSYSMSVNHLADWSDNELQILRGRIPTNSELNDGEVFDMSQYDEDDLPISLDWRLFGAVTPVKDQAVCGSCWSFGTTGAMEAAHFIKGGKLEVLSQQALIDCSWGQGNNGCDGGEDYRAYRWIKKNGLPKASAYGPYLGVDGKCQIANISAQDRVYMENYVNVTSRNKIAFKLALFHNGPLSISIDASKKGFSFYSNGVYDDPSCKFDEDNLDHSVLAVGYGVIANHPYWLVKNSWSTYWGDDGYILISQKNDCGVTTQPTFVKM